MTAVSGAYTRSVSSDTTDLSGSDPALCDASTALALIWVGPGEELRSTALTGSRLTLGRSEECDVILTAHGVSRHHAEIQRDGPLWVITDTGSTNGVYVDRTRVSRAPILPHGVLRLGDAVAVVVAGSGARLAPRFSMLEEGLYGGARFAAGLESLRRIASSSLSTVIEGETGSGKERVAHAIHRWSERSGAFVAVNCAALPVGLAESELFGHVKGAFTGAERSHAGYLRSAHLGTLLLDEVADLPLPLQAKLLRVLETKEVVPVGETRPVPADVRVISAAQRPLTQCVAAGEFRTDLMARLSEFRVVLPRLRERQEDIPGLFRLFLKSACGGTSPALSAKLIEALCCHSWPLNVRELRNVARQTAVLHSHEAVLRASHLPPEVVGSVSDESDEGSVAAPIKRGAQRDLEDLDRLIEGLRRNDGHLGAACEFAKVSRQRAQRLLNRYPERDPRR